MIRVCSVISYIFLCLPVFYQSNVIDSLVELLPKAKEQEDQADLLNQLGMAYSDQRLYNQAIHYHSRALDMSQRKKDKNNELIALKELASANIGTKDYNAAIEYAIKLQKLAEEQESKIFQAHAIAYQARIKLDVMGDFSSTRGLFIKASSIYEKEKDTRGLLRIYNDIAITYIKEKKIEQAIPYYKKALKSAEKLGETKFIHLINNNIAGAYADLGHYELAKKYNKVALSFAEARNPEMVLYDQLLLGMIQFEQGEIDQSLENMIAGSILADSIRDYPNQRWSYEFQLKIYNAKKDYKKVAMVSEQIIAVIDSMNQGEQKKNLAEKEAEIKFLLRDQELLKLEKETDRQFYLRNSIIIIAISSLGFLFFLYKRKRLLVKLQQRELDYLNFTRSVEEKEKKILKDKLNYQERALASKTMHIIQKNEILSELKNSISSLITDEAKVNPQIKKLNRTIENNIDFDNDWDKFKLHFDEVHPKFFENLKQQYPNFNNKDIRFCAYIKMGLTTKEIAQLIGVNATSIQKSRYRLKKKMELEKSVNLIEYINSNI